MSVAAMIPAPSSVTQVITPLGRSWLQIAGVISVVVPGTYALHWTNLAQVVSQIRWQAAVVRSVELPRAVCKKVRPRVDFAPLRSSPS